VLPTEDGLWVSFDDRPLINDSAEKHAMFRHVPASTPSASASAAAASAPATAASSLAAAAASSASAGDGKAGTAASAATASSAIAVPSGLETKFETKQEAKQAEQKEKRPYFLRACSAEVQVIPI
jgi:hypothetical protein